MYNSYLTGLVAAQRRQQLIDEAAAYQRARMRQAATPSRTNRSARPLPARLTRLIFAH
jgi:hypothetical protein